MEDDFSWTFDVINIVNFQREKSYVLIAVMESLEDHTGVVFEVITKYQFMGKSFTLYQQ